MIKSMTGYGEFKNKNDYAHIDVEIRSLNSRFFDFYSKSSKVLSSYDDEVKTKIKRNCIRGNFQLKATIKFLNFDQKIHINTEKVKTYLDIQFKIRKIAPSIGDISMDKLISMPDIYEIENKDVSLIKDLYFQCVSGALLELNNSRDVEGRNIEVSLKKNIDNLNKGLNIISSLHKKNIDNEYDQYKDKINKIVKDLDVDKNRLYQEIAIIIDKQDINEEIVRTDSHLNTLEKYLSKDSEVGKKINFLLQEIGREINTISSKTNNIKITHEILSMKNEVEQIREQIQNIL